LKHPTPNTPFSHILIFNKTSKKKDYEKQEVDLKNKKVYTTISIYKRSAKETTNPK